jgi:deoxyribodipyrimidine photo-lyase
MTDLPLPEPGQSAAEAWVAAHLEHLVVDRVVGSTVFRGGQSRADAALAAFDVAGYAARRNEVRPPDRRGASQLSPYIRHGLLPLRTVWNAVAGGPDRDVRKFRDELQWQEFARHWYAHLGGRTAQGVRRELTASIDPATDAREGNPATLAPWPTDMACVQLGLDELHNTGWLVNQTRMWLASHWAVRQNYDWRRGEDHFFAHLLDGSRAANRLGWQWTTGVGSSKSYGFSQFQVNKRAPGVCDSCEHHNNCPIEDWPDDPEFTSTAPIPQHAEDPTRLAGPRQPGLFDRPDAVWLTAESLGDDDPALAANPDLPVVFVFDEPLLARLRLSSKRLVFLTETLAELGTHRNLDVRLGDPTTELAGRQLAVTFAPVPGFSRRSDALHLAEIHPWPWLHRPNQGSITSFSAWRKSLR